MKKVLCFGIIICLLIGITLFGGCGEQPLPQSGSQPSADSLQTPSGTKPPLPDEGEQEPPVRLDSTAAAWLSAKVAESDGVLCIYKDADDGANHFTQKNWMGSQYRNIPAMDEAAGGYGGTTGIRAGLDLPGAYDWGGYLFTVGQKPADSNTPEPNYGEYEAGYDLGSAVRLTFRARGEQGGENIEFFTAGLGYENGRRIAEYPDSSDKIGNGRTKLTTEWQAYEIHFDGADLSRIACGFGWAADKEHNPGRDNVSFYLDEIRIEFDDARRTPVFLQSYAPAPMGTDAAVINNASYLYDNAAAAIALFRAGDAGRARQIADAIVYAAEHDRSFRDGRLRNAYMGGDPHSEPGWLSPDGNDYARMPGFYDAAAGEWYEDYYSVSTSTGNLAWAILALCEAYADSTDAADRKKYLDAAHQIADFILTLHSETGGFWGGYEGWEGAQKAAVYKSTEHNIDLIAAFANLAVLSAEADDAAARVYSESSAEAEAFVMSMYDTARGCFYTGTTDDGVTISKDVLPLDCNTWALLALGDDFRGTEGAKVMAFIEENMSVDGGYDFNDDQDHVWFEGTAQVALAYKVIGEEEKYAELVDFLNEQDLDDGSIFAADADGLSTGFFVSGLEIPWEYDRRVHVGATAWLAFAQLGTNPFDSFLRKQAG